MIVEKYVFQIPRDSLLCAADNFIDRVKICYQEDGWHFEHLLKKTFCFYVAFMFQKVFKSDNLIFD